MKNVSTALKNNLRQSDTVRASTVLVAEWNLNRYNAVTADNTPAEDTDGYDIELFPIDDIVKPNRPPQGINKAIPGQFFVREDWSDLPPTSRFYGADPKDPYKYWLSNSYSGTSSPFTFSNHTDGLTTVRPRITYGTKAVQTNKIVIGFETTWARPVNFEVWTRASSAGSFVKIATNPAIDSKGRVTLYTNSTGTLWTGTAAGATTPVNAIELRVTSMNRASSQLALIEMSARLEKDISADLIDASDEASLSETDFISPLGQISSNSGNISLFNDNNQWAKDNLTGPYAGMLDKNVKFTFGYNFTVGSTTEYVQQFVMYSEEWSDATPEVGVSLVDAASWLQDSKPLPCLYENCTIQQIVWQLLDQVGFADYEVTTVSTAPNTFVPHFWTKGEDSVWDVFQELARSTQTAIYFDAYGILKIKTRDAAFDETKTPVWTLREKSGAPLLPDAPDIISFSPVTKFEANKVNVNYTPTDWTEMTHGIPAMEVMWEAPENLVLRGVPLTEDITSTSTFFRVSPENAAVWPYEGIVNIEGEFISFKGRTFVYYKPGISTPFTVRINSDEEKTKYDTLLPFTQRYKNHLSGAIHITERGSWNTVAKDHLINYTGYNSRKFFNKATSPFDGLRHNVDYSTITLHTNGTFSSKDLFLSTFGNAADPGYYYFGTRFKINDVGTWQGAGLVFNNNGSEAQGYYVEIRPTAMMTAAIRKTRNEVVLFSKNANDAWNGYTGVDNAINIIPDKWYNLDIGFRSNGGNHNVTAAINGKVVISATIPNGQWTQPWTGKFGTFVRGYSSANFEYLYAIQSPEVARNDDEGFLDRIQGGFMGSQWDREFVWKSKTYTRIVKKKSTKVTLKSSKRYFDEFGPIVHEARRYDIAFDDDLPALHSRLYVSNDSQVICPEYTGSPFGANFVIANTSRQNAVVSGEDALSGTIDNPVAQQMLIYGRKIVQKDKEIVTRTNDPSIQARGLIELDFDTDWIQTEASATALADWVTNHWANSDTEATAEIFGNPLIELGDVVAVEYKNFHAATHLFFVTSISTAWEDGITTSLGLKRVSS